MIAIRACSTAVSLHIEWLSLVVVINLYWSQSDNT